MGTIVEDHNVGVPYQRPYLKVTFPSYQCQMKLKQT